MLIFLCVTMYYHSELPAIHYLNFVAISILGYGVITKFRQDFKVYVYDKVYDMNDLSLIGLHMCYM